METIEELPVQAIDDVTAIEPGDVVRVVDEHYRPRFGLVTAVHGPTLSKDNPGYVACINVVCVATDPAKRDPYGTGIERLTSLQHYTQGPNGMPTPGRYWVNLL